MFNWTLRSLLALATVAVVPAAWAQLPDHVLYIQANSTVAGQNAILGYRRHDDGTLTPLKGSPFATGGTGWFDPTYAVGPFDADGILAVDPVGQVLFAPNGGSDTVAALKIHADGSLAPIAGSPFATTANTPEALALRDRTLVVVANGDDPLQAGSTGTVGYLSGRLTDDDRFVEHPSASVARTAAETPTQALPIDWTPFLLTNEFTGGTISSYFLDLRGRLHLIERQSVPQEGNEASQPLPLGLAQNPVAPYVYAGLPNVSKVAVYRWDDTGHLHYVRTIANSGVAVCWITFSRDGRHMYTTNTIDNSVSVYDARDPAHPVERAHVPLRDAHGGSFQLSLSPDERFLYTIEEENAPAATGLSNQVHVLAVSHDGGTLTEVASSPMKLPVPAGNRPQGLVVY